MRKLVETRVEDGGRTELWSYRLAGMPESVNVLAWWHHKKFDAMTDLNLIGPDSIESAPDYALVSFMPWLPTLDFGELDELSTGVLRGLGMEFVEGDTAYVAVTTFDQAFVSVVVTREGGEWVCELCEQTGVLTSAAADDPKMAFENAKEIVTRR